MIKYMKGAVVWEDRKGGRKTMQTSHELYLHEALEGNVSQARRVQEFENVLGRYLEGP